MAQKKTWFNKTGGEMNKLKERLYKWCDKVFYLVLFFVLSLYAISFIIYFLEGIWGSNDLFSY